MLSLLGLKGIVIAAVVAVALGGLTFAGTKIYYAGRHAVEVENLQNTIALMIEQNARNEKAAKEDAKAALDAEAKMGELEAKIVALSNSLDDGACLSAAEVEKLRALWGD